MYGIKKLLYICTNLWGEIHGLERHFAEILTRQKPNSIRLGISPDSVNNIYFLQIP